jgi:hypothetical protein
MLAAEGYGAAEGSGLTWECREKQRADHEPERHSHHRPLRRSSHSLSPGGVSGQKAVTKRMVQDQLLTVRSLIPSWFSP